MTTFSARVLIVTLVALTGSGCASFSSLSAATPKFEARDLRPMNQDLAAWLDRLNARPAAATPAPVPSVPVALAAGSIEAIKVPAYPMPQAPAPMARTAPEQAPSTNINTRLSGAVPSPTVSASTATATTLPASAAAVAADAPSSKAANAAALPAASAPAASDYTPGQSPPPTSPTLADAAPTTASPATKPAADKLPPETKPTEQGATLTPKAVAVAPKPEVWKTTPGASMRVAVEAWATRAGWSVVWDAASDPPTLGSLRYEGSFIDAIQALFNDHASTQLHADAYTRQRLIHVPE